MLLLIELCATLCVFAAALPVVCGLYQYLLVAFSQLSTHLERCSPRCPRLAVMIPAWNEGAVIAATIDRLMDLDYPREHLRVYVVDDASTDATPEIVIAKHKVYRDRVFHVRRVAGGEGKAHTLNYGLNILWEDSWTEAVLIMDADVIYTKDSLRKMARHLEDRSIGAVTAYIKEGSRAPNYVQRFIAFEYITATGGSRRAQNVLSFLACLSGGAQLHSRQNLMAIGGQIFSHTLAEDTFTTFRTQLAGRKAIFEPNAIVYAEEPDTLTGLWKQRVRWARGNVQITRVYWRLWFNADLHPSLGSVSMGAIWFSIFLMPVFQIAASVSLIGLYIMRAPYAWTLFQTLWCIAGLTYVFITCFSFVIDGESARKSWTEGILFPGLISSAIILHSLTPGLTNTARDFAIGTPSAWIIEATTLFMYAWLALALPVAYAAKAAEARRWSKPWAPILLYVGGYGAFLCAVTFGAYVKEWQGAELKWDKTEKTGKMT